jgi:cytidine deaminase
VADIDWHRLRAEAHDAGLKAYAPYSKLKVGVAALAKLDDGREVFLTACNVENASYGLTLCAECGLVSALAAAGGGKLLAVSCTAAERDEVLMPCGRCRQLLYEFVGDDGLLVDSPDGPLPITDLLPHAFGPRDLPDH